MSAATALVGIGGAMQVYGDLYEGQANQRAAEMSAQMNEANAFRTRQQGAEEARRVQVMGKKALGDIRSSYGASGVATEASAMDVLQDSAATVALDALTVKNNADAKAWSYDAQASLDRYRGRVAKTMSYLKAGSDLLGTGGKIGGMV